MTGSTARALPESELDAYDYPLPDRLVARSRRTDGQPSRLMVVDRASGTITTTTFDSLASRLGSSNLLVRNDTRVMAARLQAERTRPVQDGPVPAGALPVEVLLCHSLGAGKWEAMVRPSKRVRRGDRLSFPEGVEADVCDDPGEELRTLKFESDQAAHLCMEQSGRLPLPPYVNQEVQDPSEYQTCFARHGGAVAAPTSGFHFSETDFRRLQESGTEVCDVTLHVGPGTFLPIRTDELSSHQMHRERYVVEESAWDRIRRARDRGTRLVALGTTTVRVLETLGTGSAGGGAPPLSGWTDLFIRPGHTFQYVDAMITNFHLPRTTLLVLVSAFGGFDLIRQAYRQAVEEEFAFYSFGDGMLVL